MNITRLVSVTAMQDYMSKIVRDSYNRNSYNDKYRSEPKITDQEDLFIRKVVKSGTQVLDIGCGSGAPYDTFMYSLGARVTGIDISECQIDRARKSCPYNEYLVTDFTKWHTDRKFDTITMFYSFFNFHRRYQLTLLKRLYDMLNDGGAVLVNVRNENVGDLKVNRNWCGAKMVWSYYGIDKFSKLLSETKFRREQYIDWYNPDYTWFILYK